MSRTFSLGVLVKVASFLASACTIRVVKTPPTPAYPCLIHLTPQAHRDGRQRSGHALPVRPQPRGRPSDQLVGPARQDSALLYLGVALAHTPERASVSFT